MGKILILVKCTPSADVSYDDHNHGTESWNFGCKKYWVLSRDILYIYMVLARKNKLLKNPFQPGICVDKVS